MNGRIWFWIYAIMGISTIIILVALLTSTTGQTYSTQVEPDSTVQQSQDRELESEPKSVLPMHQDTVLEVQGHTIELRYPEAPPKATLVLLPGWNFSRTSWCENSSICDQALAKGYVLVLVSMYQSIYADQYYPETQDFFKNSPLRTWFQDTVTAKLQQEYGLLKLGGQNYVMGLSTGGRGAAILALEDPEIYTAAASLSGDFNPNLEPEEKLMNQMYGSQKGFPERWNGSHNITRRAKEGEFKVPIYLGHGKADDIVTINQTLQFAKALQQDPDFWAKCTLHTPEGMGHNYEYWDSEVAPVLAFFKQFEQ